MKRRLLCVGLCIFCAALFLYSYIDEQNELMRMRLNIPIMAKEIRELTENNTRLKYEIELFESPQHLLQLARESRFAHLKHPLYKEILSMSEGLALHLSSEESPEGAYRKPKWNLPIGAKQ